jgi:hypothetical protein
MSDAQAAPTPATLAELVQYIESRFPVGQPGMSQHAITGETFVEFCGGIKSEGDACKASFPSERAAIEAATFDFNKYAADKAGGTLYWRIKPETDEWQYAAPGAEPLYPSFTEPQYPWRYYMRLLISSKAPMETK